jgi:hypothetical protein
VSDEYGWPVAWTATAFREDAQVLQAELSKAYAQRDELMACLKMAMDNVGVNETCAEICESPWHARALAAIAKAEGK